MKNVIKFIGVLLVMLFITSNTSLTSNDQNESDLNLLELTSASAAQPEARLAYCSNYSDRKGCRNDPQRTCSYDLFCE